MSAQSNTEAYFGRAKNARRFWKKNLDHPGIALNGPLGALALLQRARAAALTRDLPAARSAYRAFLTLWKEADTDIPVFIAAKSELARLH